MSWPWNRGQRSLRVIGTDTERSATYDFLLTFHGNHRPSTCVTRRTSNIFGDRCFAAAGPRLWNSLPINLRQCRSLEQFKRLLKTFLFSAWGHGALWYFTQSAPHINPLTYLLTYHGPMTHRFRHKRRFTSKIANFPTLVYFAPPLTGFLLELGTGARGQKTRWWAYRAEQEVWRRLQPSGYNEPTWQTDRRKDRRTDTGWQQRPRLQRSRLRIASRG